MVRKGTSVLRPRNGIERKLAVRPVLEALEERVVPTAVATIREATGPNAAAIQATVDTFRNDLGMNNGGAPGSFGGGFRPINWDGAPDSVSAPNAFPPDFFNTNFNPRSRGTVFFNANGGGFQVSNNDTADLFRFGNLNPTYPTSFSTFSDPRLFTAVGNNVVDVEFFVPGTSIPATTKGFGAVFTDVDTAGSTQMEFFDIEGNLLTRRDVLPTPGNGSLSFLGITFTSTPVARVRITSGEAALGANDVTQGPAFTSTLTGAQEVPPVATAAMGTARMNLDQTQQSLTYEITVNGLDFGAVAGMADQTPDPNDDVTRVHFHNAPRGSNGPIAFGLIDPAQDTDDLSITINPDGSTTLRGVWEQTDPASIPLSNFIPDLLAADSGQEVDLYLNVHTVRNPAGEVRGQLVSAGSNDVVAMDDFIYGEPVAINQNAPFTPQRVNQNGQLTFMQGTSFSAPLGGSQEVPPVMTNASGTARLDLDPTAQVLTYEITVRGLDFGTLAGQAQQTADPMDDVNRIHFHNAPRGSNGPIVFGLVDPAQDTDDLTFTINPDGSTTIRGAWEQTDPANTPLSNFIPALLGAGPGQDVPLYLNFHTPRNPGGEIRGQLVSNGGALSLAFQNLAAGATNPDTPIEISLGVSNGTLTLPTTQGLTFTQGDGTQDPNLVFSGTLANLNNALNGLQYAPNQNFVGGDALDFDVEDLGLDAHVPVQVGINTMSQGPGMFDPATGMWYLRNTPQGGFPDVNIFAFGAPGWSAVAGDWNGNSADGMGVVDNTGLSDPFNSIWFLRNTTTGGAPDFGPFVFGAPGWIPVVGDWDGDGDDTIGMFDPATATFFLRNSNSPGAPDGGMFSFGFAGSIPVAGDWDGDGDDTIGIFNPFTGQWFLRNTNSAGAPDAGMFTFGLPGWKPVAGDWNGSGTDGIGVIDPTGLSDQLQGQNAVWFLRNNASAGAPDFATFPFGFLTWTPVVGNWNFPSLPLQSADGVATSSAGASLDNGTLQDFVSAALGRLSDSGVDPAVIHALATAQYSVADLPGGTLGLANPSTSVVLVDADAAGHGWFLDSTPQDDEEFAPGTATGGAEGQMDLLTAVLHEMGHLAGEADLPAGVDHLMAGFLSTGTRNVDALDEVFSATSGQ